MDIWLRSSVREGRYPYRSQRENPSFSSILLDSVYRSTDGEPMRKKQSNAAVKGGGFGDEEDMASRRRACMIDKWMEKKVTEQVVLRRNAVPEFGRSSKGDLESLFLKSSLSSSGSSSESVFGVPARSSGFTAHQPRPIRTSVSVKPEKQQERERHMFDKSSHGPTKHEKGFVKTKSKAIKMYGDLKKVKQPISPGGRLANFLSSLFTAGTPKKAKTSSSVFTKGHDASTCSSASSFSRSCLSKTPLSQGKFRDGTKRSVRFVNEPTSETTKSSLRNTINEEIKFHVMEKNQRIEKAAKEILKTYQKKVEYEFDLRNVCDKFEDEDDDDGASCASSDLFELDNLSSIGIERYRQELPVYETTYLDMNRAIANGLIS